MAALAELLRGGEAAVEEARRRHLGDAVLVLAEAPHRHHGDPARELAAVIAAGEAVAEAAWGRGGRVLARLGRRWPLVFPTEAVGLAAEAALALTAEGLAGRAAVAFGELLADDREAWGLPADDAARLLTEARGGEVLVTTGFFDALRAAGGPAPGIGAWRAPADREQRAGRSFHVLVGAPLAG